MNLVSAGPSDILVIKGGCIIEEYVVTRDALRGHTVSKNGSISFFFFFLPRSHKSVHNLFIKLSPLLLGM